ncbi:resuscitation-promoting factor [Pengzhenrongella sicca]|uniref:resuscitation-promoting factor n=1 Tax=Pengzhenrongella sicca TaxID=2819238 RepID=UPI001D0BF57A|nr:resuscitation-promoting factor [Pengzhenrongella sicca]
MAVAGGGAAAYGVAHKTISVDVDGDVTQVETFAGSVEGVLRDRGIDVGARDTVAPESTASLAEGAEIVVRHATLVRVQVDGAETDVWTTALSADEALATLATRGGDVRLVASRSAAGGRAEIPIELSATGRVDVVVDGQTLAADGSRGLPAALADAGVTLTELDRVSVQHPASGVVTIVVNRVLIQEVTENQPIAFASVEQPDADRYVGKRAVATAGVAGQRTIVNRVTTVDGVETARELVSDATSIEPVTEVVSVGTKARPVAAAPAAAAATGAATATADGLNWAALAACESGGRADAVSSNGLYHGLYQFSVSTWSSVGGSGLPSQASADEQTARAQALYNRSGAGQWPHCGPRLFG